MTVYATKVFVELILEPNMPRVILACLLCCTGSFMFRSPWIRWLTSGWLYFRFRVIIDPIERVVSSLIRNYMIPNNTRPRIEDLYVLRSESYVRDSRSLRIVQLSGVAPYAFNITYHFLDPSIFC